MESSLSLRQLIATQLNSTHCPSAVICFRGRGGAEWRCVDFELGGGVRALGR
jgi:hypothetical protein